MRRRKPRPPGDFIYISVRKLLNLAIHYGLKTGSLAAQVDIDGSGGLSVGLPHVAQASIQGTVRAKHVDPGRQDREVVQLLERVVRNLSRSGLPDLESGEGDVREAGWFSFRRPLRFGIGCADSAHSVKALIAVDERPAPAGSWLPGLMMNGSPAHVRPPYGAVELQESAGSRSGSGTGQFFIWWDEFRRAWEARQAVDLLAGASLPGVESSPRGPGAALSIYRLFAGDGWLDAPELPQLLHGAPCEGIAQVSYVAVEEALTLVTASPLYIRARQLED
jgi:hypothetical protein